MNASDEVCGQAYVAMAGKITHLVMKDNNPDGKKLIAVPTKIGTAFEYERIVNPGLSEIKLLGRLDVAENSEHPIIATIK